MNTSPINSSTNSSFGWKFIICTEIHHLYKYSSFVEIHHLVEYSSFTKIRHLVEYSSFVYKFVIWLDIRHLRNSPFHWICVMSESRQFSMFIKRLPPRYHVALWFRIPFRLRVNSVHQAGVEVLLEAGFISEAGLIDGHDVAADKGIGSKVKSTWRCLWCNYEYGPRVY